METEMTRRKKMDFLGLLKDIIGMVVIANAVTGHKDQSMSNEYADTLKMILESGSSSDRR